MSRSSFLASSSFRSGVALPDVVYQTKVPPTINSEYAVAYDLTNDRWLYEKNADTMYGYPASMVKLISALVIAETKVSVIDSETVTWQSSDDPEADYPEFTLSKIGLQADDVATWEEMLHGILLQSGGDAVQACARVIGNESQSRTITDTSGYADFLNLINSRAVELGCTKTTFENGHGADQNVTTVRDMARILAAAKGNSIVSAIIAKPSYSMTVTGPNARTINLTQSNQLIVDSYVGALGGKTGTWIAGPVVTHNLANVFQTDTGDQIAVVQMNCSSSDNRYADHNRINQLSGLDFPYTKTPISADKPAAFSAADDWRIFMIGHIDPGPNSNAYSYAEIELRDDMSSDLTDPTEAATAATASQSFGSTPPVNAFDNNISNIWSSIDEDVGVWLAYGFSSAETIEELSLTSRSGSFVQQTPKHIILQYSVDGGSTWIDRFTYFDTNTWAENETRVYDASDDLPDACRYWKLEFTDTGSPGGGVTVAEIELKEVVGGLDVTSGSTASASSEFNGSLGAENAIDDDPFQLFATQNSISTPIETRREWLQIDFGDGNEKDIKEVVITAREEEQFANQAPKGWKLLKSEDGLKWQTVMFIEGEDDFTSLETRRYS